MFTFFDQYYPNSYFLQDHECVPFKNMDLQMPEMLVKQQINGYAQANDCTQFAIYGKKSIYLIDFRSNYVLFKYDLSHFQKDWIYKLKYSKDCQWLFCSTKYRNFLINCQSPEKSKRLNFYSTSIEFSNDSKFLIIFSTEKKIIIFNINTDQRVHITLDLQQKISNGYYINLPESFEQEYLSKSEIRQQNIRLNYSPRKKVYSVNYCSKNQLVIVHLISQLYHKIQLRSIYRDRLLRSIQIGRKQEYTLKKEYKVIKKIVYIHDLTTGDNADGYECSKYLPQLWRNNHMINVDNIDYIDQVIEYKQNGLSKISLAWMICYKKVYDYKNKQNLVDSN